MGTLRKSQKRAGRKDKCDKNENDFVNVGHSWGAGISERQVNSIQELPRLEHISNTNSTKRKKVEIKQKKLKS